MFDCIKCSAPIGELTNVSAQTKSIADDFWEGGTMSFYWIDPSGQMWSISYAGTYDLSPLNGRFMPQKNNNRGRVYRFNITDTIEIYHYQTQCDGYVDGTVCELRLNEGRLINYKYK